MSLLFFTKPKNSLEDSSRFTLSRSLSSWANRILYGWWCKSLWRIWLMLQLFKRSARARRRADLCVRHNMVSLTRSALPGVVADSERACGLLSFTDLSGHHFKTHNSRVLRLGTSCLWNCWRKPICVAVTDYVLINNSTAAIRCCNDQRSISTKLQTSLYMTTVSTKAALSWYAGFQISNSVVYDAPCITMVDCK